MKKLGLLIGSISIIFASNILPSEIGNCYLEKYFSSQNPPIPLNDNIIEIAKYNCRGNIIYIGIKNKIPGILKLNINSNSKNFLLTHTMVKNYPTAIYIDKNLKKGTIAIKLNNKYSLLVFFKGTNYQTILNKLKNINFEKIKEEISQP